MSLATLEGTTAVATRTAHGRAPMVPLTVSDEVGTGSVLYMPSFPRPSGTHFPCSSRAS